MSCSINTNKGGKLMTIKQIKNAFFETKEYSLFKKGKGNRQINDAHVARIKKLIAAKDTKAPIFVNKDYEIIDGHHTLQARKDLGLSVFFLMVDSDDPLDMARFNTGKKNWNLDNFLDFYCYRGKNDYKILKSKMLEYGMPVAETLTLMLGKATNTKEMTDAFKLGEFKLASGALINFDRIASQMLLINNHIGTEKKLKRQFIRAYLIMCKHPKYDFARFKSALKSKGGKLLAATSSHDYIQMFDKVYNGGLTRDKKIDLMKFAMDREFEREEREAA